MVLMLASPLSADDRPIRMTLECTTGMIRVTATRIAVERFSLRTIASLAVSCSDGEIQ
jgi:hypothetical protein